MSMLKRFSLANIARLGLPFTPPPPYILMNQ